MAKPSKSRQVVVRKTKPPTDVLVKFSRSNVVSLAKITGDSGAYVQTLLNTYPSVSEVTSLFAEYRIDRVELKFRLVTGPNNNASFPTLYIAPNNWSSGGVPGSQDEVLQFQGLQTHQFGPSNLTYSRSIRPSYKRDINNAVGGGEVVKSGFLSTLNSAITHMSFVYWLGRYNSVSDSTHTIDLETKIWLTARRTR